MDYQTKNTNTKFHIRFDKKFISYSTRGAPELDLKIVKFEFFPKS
jgi:hypothetical protein